MSEPLSTLHETLSQFFDAFARVRTVEPSPRARKEAAPYDSAALISFMDSLAQAFDTHKASAPLFDPWAVAGLSRKEVANTQVLAWLLDPKGSHGFGALALQALLAHILPVEFHTCRVKAEALPDGNSSERVDIVIDADTFYLLIEAKIDAGEQPDQLARYAAAAARRAGKRASAILFLTPDGRPPRTCSSGDNTRCISWKTLARVLEHGLRPHFREPVEKPPTRHMAEQAARRFLHHIRQF
ncbi:PD-(D/E)XK nuclease family protein [Cronobacter muytjensii]|uniref:PD-(D/E)XK nuclease family protein n=1 Tax=Cronobacter muytjensii TaxID=413501 RepID=UPI002A124C43|nr:PD-(D/E)XK nuclease family protein [Cronobacter muytjensii]ELY6274646.1 PD-(D/E)XK nuclease family protein [Cronobacter muytjensii]MEB8640969.1 PD-(D/E)XK nuclease family protein [Cronobacter muytjensii]